jgi:hypothetical protein
MRSFIRLSPSFAQHLADDCFNYSGFWGPSGNLRHAPEAWGTEPAFVPGQGSWDAAASTLSITGTTKRALGYDALWQKDEHSGRTFAIDQIGVEVRAGRGEITGVIHTARPHYNAARRQVIAIIRHANVTATLLREWNSQYEETTKTGPNSLVARVTGTAYVGAGFAAATRRWRCRAPWSNYKTDRVHAGDLIGPVIFEAGAIEGRGLAGTLDMEIGFSDPDQTEIAAAPTGSTTKLRGVFRFPITRSNALLHCQSNGIACEPVGDGSALDGGFTLTYQGRTTTVADLAVSWTSDAAGAEVVAITGTVDGQPVQIAAGASVNSTPEFLDRLGQALGTQVSGGLGGLEIRFQQTAPL